MLVPQLGVSYMLNSVVSRYARSQRVPTLMKLDVEDSNLEEGIISDLVGSGMLCRLVDEIVWENHNVSEVIAGRKFTINPKTVIGQAVDKMKSRAVAPRSRRLTMRATRLTLCPTMSRIGRDVHLPQASTVLIVWGLGHTARIVAQSGIAHVCPLVVPAQRRIRLQGRWRQKCSYVASGVGRGISESTLKGRAREPLSNQRNCASSLRAPLRALAAPSKSNVAHSWLMRVYGYPYTLSESVGVYAGRPGREVMAPPRGIEPRLPASMLARGAQLAGNPR